jgi:hypothetical protein
MDFNSQIALGSCHHQKSMAYSLIIILAPFRSQTAMLLENPSN